MEKAIENLIKDSKQVCPQCIGDGLTEEQAKSYKGGVCKYTYNTEIGDVSRTFCRAYAYPSAKWRIGRCPLNSHLDIISGYDATEKVRVGQQKQKRKR